MEKCLTLCFFSFTLVLRLYQLIEINMIPIPASQILISPDTPSDIYLAISHKTSTILSLADPNMRQIEVLPFSLASCTAYPTPSYYPFTSTSTSTQGQSNAPIIASIAKSGQVALLGHDQALHQVRPAAFESSTVTLQSALQSTGNGADDELRPVRLFDELFGPSSLSAAPSTSTSTAGALTYDMDALKMATGPGSGGKRDIFDEIPSHKLPSLSELWRGLLLPKLKPVSSSNGHGQVSKSKEGVKDEDVSDEEEEEEGEDDDDDETREEDGNEHDYAHENDEMDEDVIPQGGDAKGETKLEEKEEEASVPKQESTYENLSDEELARIFAQCMPSISLNNASSSPGKGSSGIPSERMAGKAGKDKNKKKRKSLLASMV